MAWAGDVLGVDVGVLDGVPLGDGPPETEGDPLADGLPDEDALGEPDAVGVQLGDDPGGPPPWTPWPAGVVPPPAVDV